MQCVKPLWVLIFEFFSHIKTLSEFVSLLHPLWLWDSLPLHRTTMRFHSSWRGFWSLPAEYPLPEQVSCWFLRVDTRWVMIGRVLGHRGSQTPIILSSLRSQASGLEKSNKALCAILVWFCRGRKSRAICSVSDSHTLHQTPTLLPWLCHLKSF